MVRTRSLHFPRCWVCGLGTAQPTCCETGRRASGSLVTAQRCRMRSLAPTGRATCLSFVNAREQFPCSRRPFQWKPEGKHVWKSENKNTDISNKPRILDNTATQVGNGSWANPHYTPSHFSKPRRKSLGCLSDQSSSGIPPHS